MEEKKTKINSTAVKTFGLFLIFCAVLLVACSRQELFCRFQAIEESVWHRDSVVRFEVSVSDTLSPCNVSIALRNNDRYPYKNIWLFVSVQKPSGELRRDTIECQLADNYGKWYGKGISLYELSIPYETGFTYSQSGVYVYTIAQAMRDDFLTGMSEVGLQVRIKN
ncbi:MAG: gliding motility lipoprotein GldH [Dysgonamonadaceae bacterium]|nr:gliding motility lipoprotein GldH [Dysgonamonadaceae bacterium]